MSKAEYALLQDVIIDADFPDLDLALRRGRHVDRDDAAWYSLLSDAQELLEPFYRRYGCELIHKTDGYFYLLPTGDKVSRKQLSATDMLVGQALALLYLDPAAVERGGVVTQEEVVGQLSAVLGSDALIGLFSPGKRKRQDERIAQRNVRQRVAEAVRRLAQLGFVELNEAGSVRLRAALLRFAEPVRGLSEPAEALAKLVAQGEVALAPEDAADAADEDDSDDPETLADDGLPPGPAAIAAVSGDVALEERSEAADSEQSYEDDEPSSGVVARDGTEHELPNPSPPATSANKPEKIAKPTKRSAPPVNDDLDWADINLPDPPPDLFTQRPKPDPDQAEDLDDDPYDAEAEDRDFDDGIETRAEAPALDRDSDLYARAADSDSDAHVLDPDLEDTRTEDLHLEDDVDAREADPASVLDRDPQGEARASVPDEDAHSPEPEPEPDSAARELEARADDARASEDDS